MAKLSKRARLIREKVDVLKDYDIFVMAFRFNFFDDTLFYKCEADLLKKYGKKVFVHHLHHLL